MKKIKKVLITGGTHGNELTGAYIVKKWKEIASQLPNYPFEIIPFLANPLAHEKNIRFVGQDLNRSFTDKDLLAKETETYEAERARWINQRFGEGQVDFIIDLHTTTANMKKTVVTTKKSDFDLSLLTYLDQSLPDLKIIRSSRMEEDSYFLNRICPHGLLVELGPVPQGVLSIKAINETMSIVSRVLEFLADPVDLISESKNVNCYQVYEVIEFPTDDSGEICAIVHPNIVGKDFEYISENTPLFCDFKGENLENKSEGFYPIFINEAAYFLNKLALQKTRITFLKVRCN